MALSASTMLAGALWDDRLATWIGGLMVIGIALMQIPVSEPHRWLYAALVWSTIAVVASNLRGALWASLALWCIPVGYFGLAFGAQPAVLWFSITEVAGVTALIIGSGGFYEPVQSLLDSLRTSDAGGRAGVASRGDNHMDDPGR